MCAGCLAPEYLAKGMYVHEQCFYIVFRDVLLYGLPPYLAMDLNHVEYVLWEAGI